MALSDSQMPPASDWVYTLTEPLLNYAVALAEGYDVRAWPEMGEHYWRLYMDDEPVAYIGAFKVRNMKAVTRLEHYCPSLNSRLCAEIVERERIGTLFDPDIGEWRAGRCAAGGLLDTYTGESPRLAAMRFHVAKHAERLKTLLAAI